MEKDLRAITTILWIAVVAFMLVGLCAFTQIVDGQCMQFQGWLVVHEGWIPYRDFYEFNFPMVHVYNSIGVVLFGTDEQGFTALDFAVSGGTAYAFFHLLKDDGKRIASIAALSYLLVHLAFCPTHLGQREVFMNLWIALALLFLGWGLKDKKSQWFFWGGCFAGCACLVKPTAIALVALVALVALFRSGWKKSMLFLGAVFLPICATTIILWELGALENFLTITGQDIPLHIRSFARRAIVVFPFLGTRWWFLGSIGICTVAGVAIALQKRMQVPLQLLCMLACFGAVHVIAQERYYLYHFYPALMAGVGLFAWMAFRGTSNRLPFACIASTVTVIAVLQWNPKTVEHRNDMNRESKAMLVRDLTHAIPRGGAIQMVSITTDIHSAVAQGDWHYASPYLYGFPLLVYDESAHTISRRHDFEERMLADPPDAVVLSLRYYASTQERLRETVPKFSHLLDTQYSCFTRPRRYIFCRHTPLSPAIRLEPSE